LKTKIVRILKEWRVKEEVIENIVDDVLKTLPTIEKLTKGAKIEDCVYWACRRKGIPVFYRPSRSYYKILQSLDGVPIGLPERYIPTICKRLHLDETVAKLATEILSEWPKLAVMGRAERTLAAAAVYLASRKLGLGISQQKIAREAAVTEVSMRNAIKSMKSLMIQKEEKAKLLEFLRNNPKATTADVIKAGYGHILQKLYGGKINRARSEAGIPARVGRRGLPLTTWEERKIKLLEFLKRNPQATVEDLIRAGHWVTLKKFYRGSINKAKIEIGIPIRKRGKEQSQTI
jgi:hypothetical protein